MLNCQYIGRCSGCDWLEKPYDLQRETKLTGLRQLLQSLPLPVGAWPEVKWIGIAEGGLRDRADLVIDQRTGEYRLGLFDRDHQEIIDIEKCPQMSPELQSWYEDFRKIKIPVQRGSIRLRVSPSSQRGIWLDLANVDVKMLLDERKTLDTLRTMAIVEIGQKRKRLVERDSQLKLADAILEPWFQTSIVEADGTIKNVALYCAIGSFTQTGLKANTALVTEVRSRLQEIREQAGSGPFRAVEFGSGIGNFTLPLASICSEVRAYEVDALALQGLERTLSEHENLKGKVQIFSGNFQVERKQPVDFGGADLAFVDPPRSGLMKFLDPLAALPLEYRPRNFVYVSCYPESFVSDTRRLIDLGYRPQSVAIVDQFPQSRHYEIVATFLTSDKV